MLQHVNLICQSTKFFLFFVSRFLSRNPISQCFFILFWNTFWLEHDFPFLDFISCHIVILIILHLFPSSLFFSYHFIFLHFFFNLSKWFHLFINGFNWLWRRKAYVLMRHIVMTGILINNWIERSSTIRLHRSMRQIIAFFFIIIVWSAAYTAL